MNYLTAKDISEKYELSIHTVRIWSVKDYLVRKKGFYRPILYAEDKNMFFLVRNAQSRKIALSKNKDDEDDTRIYFDYKKDMSGIMVNYNH